MAHIDLSADMPSNNTVAQAPAVEDAFTQIENAINGGLDATNFATGLIFDPAKIEQKSATTGQALIWNGSGWGPASVSLTIASVSLTSTTNITGTTSGSPTDLISLGAQTFDGTACLFEFSSARLDLPTVAGASVAFALYDGTTEVGRLGLFTNAASASASFPVFLRLPFTPSAGAHTYKISGYVSSTTGTPRIVANAITTGDSEGPALFRVIHA